MSDRAQRRDENIPARGPLMVLAALAVLEICLAIYQWLELLKVRSGEEIACSVNATVDCVTVWDSALASFLHSVTGLPVAGLGIVWGATALFQAVKLLMDLERKPGLVPQVSGLKLTAVVGLIGVVVFALGSFEAGSLCLTCLGTYVLVGAFAFVALAKLPGPTIPQAQVRGRALLWALAPALAAYALLLIPGLSTPNADRHEPIDASAVRERLEAGDSRDQVLRQYLSGLSADEQLRVSRALAHYKRTRQQVTTPPRWLDGSPDAPVRITEWSDMRCGHCGRLSQVMGEVEEAAPEGSLAIDSRNFPLDSECNTHMEASDGTGIRCMGAKVHICLEGTEAYNPVRRRLFGMQNALTPERILQVAAEMSSLSRTELLACVNDEATAEKLAADVAEANRLGLQGTPLVLLNGRRVPYMAPFLLAMALAEGNPDHPAFQILPSSRG